jgi:hypothetical protein
MCILSLRECAYDVNEEWWHHNQTSARFATLDSLWLIRRMHSYNAETIRQIRGCNHDLNSQIRHSVYVIKCGYITSHLHKQNPEWIMQLSEMSDLSEWKNIIDVSDYDVLICCNWISMLKNWVIIIVLFRQAFINYRFPQDMNVKHEWRDDDYITDNKKARNSIILCILSKRKTNQTWTNKENMYCNLWLCNVRIS